MRITVPEIDCSEGFTNKNDLFERKKLSKRLENIIENSDDENLVIAINDIWGNGKTTFLKMWEAELKENDKFQVVYFDAFKNDFQTDPFIAIASHIYSIIEDNSKKQKYLEATKRAANVLFKASIKFGISALTLGAVKGTEVENLGDSLKDAVSEPIDNYLENKITQLENENNSIEHFKHVLSETGKEKKVIFIIDELDRARPNYSLELLEKIKHVFNTTNIYFILSFDKEQFKHVIRKNYGDIDADIYLNKFVHLWFSLPKEESTYTQRPTMKKYLEYINRTILERDDRLKTSIVILTTLLRINNFSLRDAERCFSLLLVATAQEENSYRWEYQVGFAIIAFLKLKNESIIKKIYTKTITKDEILKELGINETITKSTAHIIMAINTELLSDDDYSKALEENKNTVFGADYGDRPQTLTFAIERMYDITL